MVDFGPNDEFGSQNSSVYWWLKSKDQEVLDALNADFKHLSTDTGRITAYETYASLYSNRVNAEDTMLTGYEMDWAVTEDKYTRCPYNLMKIIIDEVLSRIIKSQPRAKFLTHGGNREAKRRAKLMERWNANEVHRLRQDEKLVQLIMDACIFGLGALKISKRLGEYRLDAIRTYPGNLYVDCQETTFSEPTRLHHREFVSKEWLKMMFPKRAKDIESSGAISDAAQHIGYYQQYAGNVDRVELIESWHLPSTVKDGVPSKDGVRYLWCDRVLLQKSPWSRRSFPFAFFNWKRNPHNTFYGIGLGEDLLGVHMDANVTLNRVNTAIEMLPNPYVLVRKGTEIDLVDITNAAGTFIEWSGPEPPQIVLPQSVPGDLLQYVREHEQRAMRIAGLPGQDMPESLQTGRAVEMSYQTQNVPFAQQLQKFETLIVDVAECNVAATREIAQLAKESGEKFTVVLEDEKYTIEELDWDDVQLDPRESSYVIRAVPVSVLSDTFATRLSEVERISTMFPTMPEMEKRQLLSMPDLASSEDLGTAALSNIDRIIGLAIDKGIYTAPSPFMDLELFIIRGNEAEQRAQDMDVPESHCQTLRMMIRVANGMRQKQIQSAALQQQGMTTPAVSPQSPTTGQAPNAIVG